MIRSLLPLPAACAALLLAGAALAHSHAAGNLKIGHPWSRPTVAGQPSGAGYLTVTNGGRTPDRLLRGASPAAQRVELHSMKMEGDVMRMRQVDAIEIPAGATVELKPGGLHLMLIGLKAPLKAGTKVPATLTFEKAGEVQVELSVQEPKGDPAPAHKH